MSDQERLDALEAEGLKMHTPEFERDIAETMAEREVPVWKLKLAQENARRRAERREAIAKGVLIALIHIVEAYDAQQTMADTYDATMEMDEAVKEARAVLLAAWQEVTK